MASEEVHVGGESAADPDWQLLARVAGGDGEAFAGLVERYQNRLLRVCERMLGDAEEARDAVQEVFLKVYRKAATFKPRGQLYTLLYRIAVNHCLNRLRRRKMVRFLRLDDAPAGGAGGEGAAFEPPDAAPDPAATLAARQRWQATRAALAALPPGQRAVLVLAKFEGVSYKGIARILGITVGAVESRLFRAMRNLEAAAQETAEPRVSQKGEDP